MKAEEDYLVYEKRRELTTLFLPLPFQQTKKGEKERKREGRL